MSFISYANTISKQTVIFTIGILWYISEPYTLRNINPIADICSDCAYSSVFHPKPTDLLFNGFGQILFQIQNNIEKSAYTLYGNR